MPNLVVREHPLLAYDVWRSMHKRCKDPKTNGYFRYGGKGIKVCDEWGTYESFFADMGWRPSPKHHLDRIDSSKGYSKDNCRWVSARENERNKSSTRFIEFNGIIKTLTEWASELGFANSTLANRLAKWGVERAFTQPHGPTGPKRKG